MNATSVADAFNKAFAHPFILILIFIVAILLVGICTDVVQNWFKHVHGRNWPTADAVIDIVSVAFIPDDSLIPPSQPSLDSSHYKATLTYIYHTPEEQMGDYSRDFVTEEDAKDWANSYKGETIKVHVDPRDPSHSVLREEDL